MKNRLRQKQAVPLFAALLVSCASAPAAPPEWAAWGAEAVYPRDVYIAAEGRGKTAKQAEQDAAAALALYFSAEVTAVSHSREAWSSETGYSGQASSETFVRSAMQLFALRRAAPWHDSGEKTWRALAYIDRAEAWAMFEPRVRKEADAFRALWRAAESETAALKSYFDYRRAQEYTRRGEFANTMTFGEALYPQKMTALTGDIRQNAAQLGAKLNEARNRAQIFIDCPKDFESAVGSALAKLLSGEGLIVTGNKKQAAAVCAATVDEGFQPGGDGYFYYPKISVIITDTRGVALFSYSASAGKQGAITAEVAKRRAYGALAAELENNFALEL